MSEGGNSTSQHASTEEFKYDSAWVYLIPAPKIRDNSKRIFGYENEVDLEAFSKAICKSYTLEEVESLKDSGESQLLPDEEAFPVTISPCKFLSCAMTVASLEDHAFGGTLSARYFTMKFSSRVSADRAIRLYKRLCQKIDRKRGDEHSHFFYPCQILAYDVGQAEYYTSDYFEENRVQRMQRQEVVPNDQ